MKTQKQHVLQDNNLNRRIIIIIVGILYRKICHLNRKIKEHLGMSKMRLFAFSFYSVELLMSCFSFSRFSVMNIARVRVKSSHPSDLNN